MLTRLIAVAVSAGALLIAQPFEAVRRSVASRSGRAQWPVFAGVKRFHFALPRRGSHPAGIRAYAVE
jgi:hypothetical protein